MSPQATQQPYNGFVCGPFDRKVAEFEESHAVHQAFRSAGYSRGVMVDVGAHFGGSLRPFANDGWEVHAFEPDPSNRAHLLKHKGPDWNLTITDRAISLEDDETLSFFQSAESTGVSTLHPFLDSHESTLTVTTRRLDTYYAEHELGHVNFLKVDAEGFDGILLQSFPFHLDRPDVVTCEFEDMKTGRLDYTSNDVVGWLLSFGYEVFVSQWHPIVTYGISHDFYGLWHYSDELIERATWGNLVAIAPGPLVDAFLVAAQFWTPKC